MKPMTVLSSSIALFLSLSAFAGPRSDGGGKGVLCQTDGGATIEALDIYEAKNIYRFGEAPRQGSIYAELGFAFLRFDQAQIGPHAPATDPGKESDWKDFYDREFGNKVIEIPAGARLPETTDATLPILPPSCRIVQVAVFNSLGVQLDKEYWEMMDARNQAALVFHELLYPYRKKYGATNSDETRRFVGQLFSERPPVQRFLGAPKTGYLECRAGGPTQGPVYDFVVYPAVEDGKTVNVISFRQIDNATLLGRMIAKSGGGDSSLVESMRSGRVSLSAALESESHDETRSFILNSSIDHQSGIRITVSTRDDYTGKKSAVSTGSCWEK